jgi:tetrahydromethanopterin S-methyltransferase subunit A
MESGFMDYNEFKNLLDKSEPTNLYEELIQKEDRVLKTVNRVVDYSNRKDLESKEFINMSVGNATVGFLQTMVDIVQDLTKAKDAMQFVTVLYKGDRVVYIGILVVLISLFLFFVQSSSVLN